MEEGGIQLGTHSHAEILVRMLNNAKIFVIEKLCRVKDFAGIGLCALMHVANPPVFLKKVETMTVSS